MLLRVEAQEPLRTRKFDGLALRLGRDLVPHVACAFAGELHAADTPLADLLPGTYGERNVFLPCQLGSDGKGNSIWDPFTIRITLLSSVRMLVPHGNVRNSLRASAII